MDDDKEKRGSGKSPTKFMERPGTKPEKKGGEKPVEQGQPEFIEDDLEALESQEKQDEEVSKPESDGSKPGRKGDQKPDPRKWQDPAKQEDTGGDAC